MLLNDELKLLAADEDIDDDVGNMDDDSGDNPL